MSVKWNAATRYSAHPFTTKTGARVHFFCLNYPRIRGWYQARVHPFSSGNGKGDPMAIKWTPNCLHMDVTGNSGHATRAGAAVVKHQFGNQACLISMGGMMQSGQV